MPCSEVAMMTHNTEMEHENENSSKFRLGKASILIKGRDEVRQLISLVTVVAGGLTWRNRSWATLSGLSDKAFPPGDGVDYRA